MANPSDPVDLLNFIDEVKKIKTEYNTIAKYTGINFNIFKILKVDRKEVKLHSNFLAEMLNPQGSHMQGNTFLNIFLEEIENKIKWNLQGMKGFKIEGAVVYKEFPAGKINKEYTEGGSIDILIKNKHQGIIIENKIDAGDQVKQLKRYYNFGKKIFNSEDNFRVLYLTLDCSPPSEISTDGIKHFSCISYKTHIKNWLEKCLTVVYDSPLVFALIRQYLNHIKHLTNQSIFEKMNDKIKDKIRVDQDAFKASREISNSLLQIRAELFKEISKYFYKYFSRSQNPQSILNSNVNIILGNDGPDGYWVGLGINKTQNVGIDFNHIKKIALGTGGSNGSNNLLSWYTLKSLPKNLDYYSDDEVWLLLQEENLGILHKQIDDEIDEILNRVITALN